jgi:arylsulfatase
MITSTYPFDYGEYLEFSTPARLSRKRILLSEILKTHRYSTAFFHDNPYLSPLFGYSRGFDLVVDFGNRGQPSSKIKRPVFSILRSKKTQRMIWRTKNLMSFLKWYFRGIPLHTNAETVLKEAYKWVRKTSFPYFLWMHLMDTHVPYSPKHEILDKFGINKFNAFRVIYKHFRRKELTDEEFEIFKLLYDAQIYQVDCALSKYLPKITRGNISDSYVIITADHGEELEDKRKVGHAGRLTYKLLRVPLMICGGGLEPKIIDTKASLINLAPTILDLLEIQKPKSYKGTSLLRKSKPEQIIAQGIFKEEKCQQIF